MKLMNEIQSETTGEVAKIYVENGQPVEYGQPLFGIKELAVIPSNTDVTRRRSACCEPQSLDVGFCNVHVVKHSQIQKDTDRQSWRDCLSRYLDLQRDGY